MSRERCLSLDRAQRAQQQRKNVLRSGGYIPGISPNRYPIHVPSAPEIVRQNYDGDITSHTLTDYDFEDQEQFNRSCALQYENNFEDIASRRSDELQEEFYTVNPPQIEDLPDEFLEQFEEPSFYEIPANASFDEVMCAMATPPGAERPEVELAEVRKRIAANIGETVSEEGTAELVIDDVRKRMAAMIAESESKTEQCLYRIPPLPEDSRAIPPHPKDPKDVVAIIRRAKAIARLKAIEEAEAAAKAPKGAVKKGNTGVPASKKPPPKRLVGPSGKGRLPPGKAGTNNKTCVGLKKIQVCPLSHQHPPDYVAPEWAAAILRTRNLVGLKTKNPKLLPKPKTPPPLPAPTTSLSPPPLNPPTPSYDNVRERAAVIKLRKDAAKAAALAQQTGLRTSLTPKASSPIVEDDLDEFEALEQIYDVAPNQYSTTVAKDTDMQNRMAALRRQLFQSPAVSEPSPSAKSPSRSQSPVFELPPILRYHALLKHRETMAAAETQAAVASKSPACPVPEYEVDLAQFQGIADWGLADLSGPHPREILHMPASPKDGTAFRSHQPRTPYPVQSRFDDAFLQNLEMPDFDVGDIPDFAFSAEAMADAGFVIDKDVPLGEISMPDFEEDISIEEYGLEDITSPNLCNLSISGSDMALEPDYPLEMMEEVSVDGNEQFAKDEVSKTPGFLTSVVNGVVDRFKNIFTPTKLSKDEEYDDDNLLDTSLPNLFETTPPPKSKSPVPEEPKPATTEGAIVIPPHPKDPKDFAAIVKRAQAIQKKKAKEAAAAAAAAPFPSFSSTAKNKKHEITSSIPKRAPPPKKKSKRKDERPTKVYPAGEYSPGYAAAVARARSLAGFKNISAVLNPERAARIAEIKASKEAELAAIEALPAIERMRTKMEHSKTRKPGYTCPRPSIEALGALEAIRASLPKPEIKTMKRKWKPTGRLRSDRRTKPEERVFTQDFGRVLVPTSRTVNAKKVRRKLDVMSPLIEEEVIPEDFIKFSPLKPHEGQMRLQYLKEQAARRAAETIRAAEEAHAEICPKTLQSRRSRSPKTPEITPAKYSPIRLHSPGSPRTEQTRKEIVTTQIGENGGEETIREEIVETSTIENGEVHTSTKHVTTKTDEYGNVSCHIKEGKGMSGEEDAIHEHLANVEPPDFFNTSDIPPPIDPSIPTPSEIIDRIRLKVQQKLSMALPTVPASTQLTQPPGIIEFPEDFTDEELFDIDIPEFERTPQRESPRTRILTPIEKDERMYAWGEQPAVTPIPITPKPQTPFPPEVETYPTPKPTSPQGPIVIPPHPKDPKNYLAMVKRAQAIQKRKKQQDIEAAAQPHPPAGKTKINVNAPPLKDSKKPPRKRFISKKQIPKAAPKKYFKEHQERECPVEPPPLPENYAEHVAKARLIHGLTNRTAALNPKIAEQLATKKAADEAAQAAYEALPEHEKIKIRMEQLRRIPSEKRHVKASVDMLGTIAAIRENMPPIEEILRPLSPKTPYTPSQQPFQTRDQLSLRAPVRGRGHRSPIRTDTNALMEAIENAKGIWEDEQQQERLQEVCLQENIYKESKQLDITPIRSRAQSPQRVTSRTHSPGRAEKLSSDQAPSREPMIFKDLSLEEFEALEAMANLSSEQFEAVQMETNKSCQAYTSLDEFEALEAQLSLDEFEALEAEAKAEAELVNCETPKRKERYFGRRLFTPPPPPVKSQRLQTTPSRASCPQRPPRLSLTGSEYNYDNLLLGKGDTRMGGIYYDEIQDFIIPNEQIILETSHLMPESPTSLQERFRRIKEAQQRQRSPQIVAYEVASVSSIGSYSPISLMSPNGAPCKASIDQIEKSLPSATKGELLVDFDQEAPKRHVRRFDDLEDMPFDELEFEDEPSFKNISLDKPMTPPPLPSDIISRVRSKVEKKMREDAQRSPPRCPGIIEFPEDIPDEELFDLSAPAFEQTSQITPAARERSPRVSLPMAWGETQPLTPKTPPVRVPSPSRMQTRPEPEVVEVSSPTKVPSLEKVPPHPKDPKDFEAIIKRAQAIHKLKRQEAEAALAASLFEPPKRKGQVPISRWQGPPPKRHNAKPRKKLVMRNRGQPLIKDDEEERVCPAEPPPLPENYAEHVARARLIQGLKNKTAALNPKVAARIVAKKAAAAAYDALPEHEKIKVRMERLRQIPGRYRGAKPTIEQIAYLEALKQTEAYDYKTSSRAMSPHGIVVPSTPHGIVPSTPRTSAICEVALTPQCNLSDRVFTESLDLDEFEALEQIEGQPIVRPSSPQVSTDLAQRMAYLEQQMLESKEYSPMSDVSLAEFEALEAVVAPPDQCPGRLVSPLKISQMIAALQEQTLATPPRINPSERYRQVLAQMQATPKSPEFTTETHKSPDIHYSPLRLTGSPSKGEETTRAEKTTTQITRSGNNTIKEQVIETSEIANGELQQITKHVTTTTDPNGNVTCQINESKRVSARDTSADWEQIEDLGDIEEPSFLDTTPLTPLERPRPRDIIERVGREAKEGVGKYRPEVPTGPLIDLRTPPRMLPLPEEVSNQNLFDLSSPAFTRTPPRSPVRTPKGRSPERTQNISIPEMFVSTPPPTMPPTPSLPPVSLLRQRVPSPERPIVIPPHPKDPTDFAAIVRRARKIQQLRAQEEAERFVAEEVFAAKTAKPKRRVPLSRWTAPPAKKPRTRKKLVMRKRGEHIPAKTPGKALMTEKQEPRECPAEPPPHPEDYAEHIARSRKLAGLKNRTAALNPKVAAREAEIARLQALNVPPPPIKDFSDLLSRMTSMREKGPIPKGQPSIAAAAYLNALKGAMQISQQQSVVHPIESPKARYRRLKAERVTVPEPTFEVSPVRIPRREDISYTPLPFVSPPSQGDNINLAEEAEDIAFNIADFEGLEELAELEEPSYMNVSESPQDEDQYMPLTPPETPTKIISRIRQRVRQQQPHVCPSTIPVTLEFPIDLPEEELLELSAPSFATSPPRYETPLRSPNISIPQYFEETPPPTPKAVTKRAHLIQKLGERETAEEAAKVQLHAINYPREPLSRRPTKPGSPDPTKPSRFAHSKKGRLFRKLVLKKKAPPVDVQAAVPTSLRECPLEPPVLPSDYIEAVARARKLAGLKRKVTAREAGLAADADIQRARPPLPDFATIMERAADLRAAKTSGTHQELTARQLTAKQNLINRQQRKRLLRELEIIRQQQAAENIPLDFGPMNTPPAARQRFEILKSRMRTETPIAGQIPYSPAKTPDLADLPQYQPLAMPKTPPYEFLENFNIPDIEDMSMPYDELDDYEMIEEPARRDFSADQHEFDIAEAEAAAIEHLNKNDRMEMVQSQSRQRATELDTFEVDEAEAAAHEFNIRQRIETLQNQLFESPRQKLISRSAAAEIEQELEMGKAEAAVQDFDLANRIQELENLYFQTPRPRTSSPRGNKVTGAAAKYISQHEQLLENERQYPTATSQQQDMDEFEAMERECR